jgi:hypothetical protein
LFLCSLIVFDHYEPRKQPHPRCLTALALAVFAVSEFENCVLPTGQGGSVVRIEHREATTEAFEELTHSFLNMVLTEAGML